MPVKQLRRLDAPVDDSLHAQMSAHIVTSVGSHAELDAIEREHPDLIIRSGGNLLAASGTPLARLSYGFDGERAFVEQFPAMFEKLLPKLRRSLGADSVRLRLSYSPGRPVIEPVLKRLWFTPTRDWLEFTLARDAKLPAAPLPAGARIADGRAQDNADLARIDREAFPNTPMSAEGIRARIDAGERVLVATRRTVIVGYCMYSQPDSGRGFIHVLAVDASARGAGVGAALTVRAMKRLFADGAQAVALTTDADNGDAIRLYLRLGYRQTAAGRDYRRPTSDRAVEKLRTDAQGTFIKFGGWR